MSRMTGVNVPFISPRMFRDFVDARLSAHQGGGRPSERLSHLRKHDACREDLLSVFPR